jgi:hypothetical protein
MLLMMNRAPDGDASVAQKSWSAIPAIAASKAGIASSPTNPE